MVKKKKTIKKKPKWNENATIRGALRRAFSRSPAVQDCKRASRRESVQYKKDGSVAKRPAVRYQCAECGEWFMGKDVAVDHIDPVVNDGFKDWNVFVDRLFCNPDNLQVLCSYKLADVKKHNDKISCHLKKTREERTAAKKKTNK